MADRQPKRERGRQGRRHPLLYQQQLNEQSFWPSILILAVSAGLLIWNPAQFETYRLHLIMLLVGSALILVLTFALRLMAYVQCRQDGLHLNLPFYRLTIPYREIKNIRPTELYRMFPPREQRWTQRHFLRLLFGRTVLVIEMEELPRSRSWLRLWMSNYMLCPDAIGLILSVRDWIAFRTELDELRARFR